MPDHSEDIANLIFQIFQTLSPDRQAAMLDRLAQAQYYASANSSSSALFLYFPNRGGEAKVYGAVADQLWSALLEEIKDLVVIEESSLTPEANL